METINDLIGRIQGLMSSWEQMVTISDIVDILIVTYLIYSILSFMRRTSSSSVIKGIVLVLIVAGLSNFFKMSVLNYLLRQVLQMGIIVIIILFQPEIRKMFEQMGASRFYLLFRKRGRFESIETGIQNVVMASEAMAKNETGALIVFEREIGLNDYVVTGTKVDACITSELLQNIFFHNSPLHDGAVIVRDGRLLAAACMLPLSNNINLSRELGMRHRAGIGISERSDAVVVIVSEETGTLSVAIDGMIKRHLAKDTFEMLLRNEILASESGRKKRKKTKKPYAVNSGASKEGQKK